jgi:hypothetical protein
MNTSLEQYWSAVQGLSDVTKKVDAITTAEKPVHFDDFVKIRAEMSEAMQKVSEILATLYD